MTLSDCLMKQINTATTEFVCKDDWRTSSFEAEFSLLQSQSWINPYSLAPTCRLCLLCFFLSLCLTEQRTIFITEKVAIGGFWLCTKFFCQHCRLIESDYVMYRILFSMQTYIFIVVRLNHNVCAFRMFNEK